VTFRDAKKCSRVFGSVFFSTAIATESVRFRVGRVVCLARWPPKRVMSLRCKAGRLGSPLSRRARRQRPQSSPSFRCALCQISHQRQGIGWASGIFFLRPLWRGQLTSEIIWHGSCHRLLPNLDCRNRPCSYRHPVHSGGGEPPVRVACPWPDFGVAVH